MTKKQPVKAKPLDVICPACRGIFHETTEHYDPDRSPNTSMCRLKAPYKSWGWNDFHSPPPGEGSGNMECPGCGAALVVGSKLVTNGKPVSRRKAIQTKNTELDEIMA